MAAAVIYLNDRKPGTHLYWPEMGDRTPDCKIEASLGYYGKHYFLDTPLELKGRGITFIKKYESKDLSHFYLYKAGWNEYQVTTRAFDLLKKQYPISMKCYLD